MKTQKMKRMQNIALSLAVIGIFTAAFAVSDVYAKRKPMAKAEPTSAQVETAEKTSKKTKADAIVEDKLPEKEKPNPLVTEEKSEDAEVTNSNPGNSSPSTKSGNSGSSPNNNQPSNSTLPPETTTVKAENNYLTRAEMEALANEMVAYSNSYAMSRGVIIDNTLTAEDGEGGVDGISYDPAQNVNLKTKIKEGNDFLIDVKGIKRLRTVWYWSGDWIIIDYYYNW